MRVKRIQEGAQHTALRGARAECQGGRCLCPHLHCLWTVRQEAVNPFTGWGREIQVSQLPDENVRQDCVKRRTKVNKKHPDIIPLFSQVTCCSVWWTVAIASAVDLFAL